MPGIFWKPGFILIVTGRNLKSGSCKRKTSYYFSATSSVSLMRASDPPDSLLQGYIQVHRMPSVGVKEWLVHHTVNSELQLRGVTSDRFADV